MIPNSKFQIPNSSASLFKMTQAKVTKPWSTPTLTGRKRERGEAPARKKKKSIESFQIN
jgi:hypothetical protein